MLGVAIASFLLLLVVAYLIARPFLALPETEDPGVDQLLEDEERLLAALRELDMDFNTGKLPEDDYRKLRARRIAQIDATRQAIEKADVEAEEADVEVQTDETELETTEEVVPELAAASGNGSAPTDLDDELERAIAARKHVLEERPCPACGVPYHTEDRFCRSCGADLARAGTG